MGQAVSSPAPSSSPLPSSADVQQPDTRRRSTLWRRSLASPPASSERAQDDRHVSPSPLSSPSPSRSHQRPRPRAFGSTSTHRLSRLLRSSDNTIANTNDSDDQIGSTPSSTRPSRLQRARTSLSNFRVRHSPFTPPAALNRSRTDDFGYGLPHVELNFDNFELNLDLATADHPSRTPSSPSLASFRLPTSFSDRLSALRSDRLSRNSLLRPRQPTSTSATLSSEHNSDSDLTTSWTPTAAPTPSNTTLANPTGSADASIGAGEEVDNQVREGGADNTALISRILSVAAATTAATLLEGDQQAIADAQSVHGDGTFSNFLQSLESGRLASAMRQGSQNSTTAPLNFFRMFRFGSATSDAAGNNDPSAAQSPAGSPDARMVPVIIVGIRSVSQATANSAQETAMPPFLDALSALPRTPFNGESDSIDSILGPNPTHRFSHRRRASMGGLSNFPSAYDAQRHSSTSPVDRSRPRSVATSRPPLSLSPSLSRVSSASSVAAARMPERPSSSRSNSNYSDRRESIIRTTTTTTTTLETTQEDAPLRPRPHRPRRLSESDYGRHGYSSRRNGIVEPDNMPSENTRSWIIYVLGGSYPENHPIITTPSLYTDSPTYEDMMLLSALLGPAKPPVASEQDVADAPGILKIQSDGQNLAAVALDNHETVPLTSEQRCLVCLCDFEHDEEARKLVKCGHLFHKDCIDQWLTTGRNSCPLCRGQGVDEKEKPSPTSTEADTTSTAADTSAFNASTIV